MKKVGCLLLSILFLYNCTSNTIYKAPTDLIPKDSMVVLIQEMIVASASKNAKNIYQQRKVDYMPFIYDRFKIDSIRFKKSSLYYISKIDDYSTILKQVRVNLTKEKDGFVAVKKIKDSLLKDSIDAMNLSTVKKKLTKIKKEIGVKQ